ncbi:sensor histidine kinase [Imbroritus primus]|uniref:Sensor histidine kinase n=1 Tax=Imbroritus primus TaxID=3058603 RepID=A0ACD3SPN1_9BURK|nr:sensor histidine kinase [Burkholderiaceae bacterium PBA]
MRRLLPRNSLRSRLLGDLWKPLFCLLLLGAVAVFFLARHIGSSVYDRWLYDSAMTLAEQVRVEDGKAVLDLPKQAVEMFEWDQVDRIFSDVRSRRYGLIFRNSDLPPPPEELQPGQSRIFPHWVKGHAARVVAVAVPNPADPADVLVIQVAETMLKRNTLATDILVLVVPVLVVLALLVGIVVWRAVATGVRAVDQVVERLDSYGPDRLLPVGEITNAPAEVRPLLNAINQLIRRLSDLQDTQRRFIANAAHQLRTPLATLQVQTERALREPDAARHGQALSRVLKAVTRSRHLAHQLLMLARSEQSGEKALQMQEVDLAVLARDELERWIDSALQQHVDIGYDGPESGVEVYGEPVLLRELIGNLVDNAIRYGSVRDDGRRGGAVTLRLQVQPIMLVVEDDGPGIPPSERTLVLERFYRRRGAGGQGCGLGLSIAREIAQRHGARLVITDPPQGMGARVEIRFAR